MRVPRVLKTQDVTFLPLKLAPREVLVKGYKVSSDRRTWHEVYPQLVTAANNNVSCA
jgi:hypothetical protein